MPPKPILQETTTSPHLVSGYCRKIKPKILFICVGNFCRSQMAEGFARSIGGDKLEVFSAGSRPAGSVCAAAVDVMNEAGIDISGQFSKGLSQVPQEKYDVIVTMGCGGFCPHLPAQQKFDWKIPDPAGQSDIQVFRDVRDLIHRQILTLLEEIKPAT